MELPLLRYGGGVCTECAGVGEGFSGLGRDDATGYGNRYAGIDGLGVALEVGVGVGVRLGLGVDSLEVWLRGGMGLGFEEADDGLGVGLRAKALIF